MIINNRPATGCALMPRIEWAVSWPVREIGGGDLEGQAWRGLGMHRADLGADDEKLPVHLGEGGGAVPVRVGQFGHDRRRAPAGCQPGHADHEADVLDVVAAVGDAVEHVTVEQHPIGVELIAAKVDRGGGDWPGRPATGCRPRPGRRPRSEEHTSELQSRRELVCRLLLEKKKKKIVTTVKSLIQYRVIE